MDLGLEGKVVLITGSSRGIGLRTARAFAAEGCHLGICGRNAETLDIAAGELSDLGVHLVAVQADVTILDDAARFIERCAAELGRIDIMVNNVGGNVGSGPLLDITDKDWLSTYELNVFQSMRLIRLVTPHMRRGGGGAVVNVSSISGWYPQLSGTPQYGSSKAALIFLTERLALELAPDNIRVNTVSPGSIIWEGGGWDSFRLDHPESFNRYVQDGFPMGRLGKPEEIADVIVFLASSRSSWINGRNIPVDGLEQPIPAKYID